MSEEEEREEEERESKEPPVSRGVFVGYGADILVRRAQAVRDFRAAVIDRRYFWSEAGPEGLTTSATMGGGPQGSEPIAGMVMDLAFAGDRLVAATTEGGLWDSTDAGAAWRPLTDSLPALTTGAVAIGFAALDLVIIAGTSDTHAWVSAPPRCGLYRSCDGGATWTVLDGGDGGTRFGSRDVNWIRMVDMHRLLVATDAGLFWSADGGYNFGANDAANDGHPLRGGRITELRIVNGPPDVAYFAVAGDGLYALDIPAMGTPGHPRKLHRARDTVDRERAGHIAFDHAFPGGTEFWLMSVARSDAKKGEHHSVQIARGDGTGGWEAMPAAAFADLVDDDNPQTSYDHLAALDPSYSSPADQIVGYLGAIELLGARLNIDPPGGGPILPAGGTFDVVADGVLHDDQHVVVFDTANGNAMDGTRAARMYVGNDGGLYRSDAPLDPTTWIGRSRMRTALFYALSVASRPGGGELMVAGGMQDKGTAFGSTTVAEPASAADWTWDQIGGGDGGAATIHPLPPGHASGWDVVVILLVNDRVARSFRVAGGGWQINRRLVDRPDKVNFSGVLARARGADSLFSVVYVALAKGEFLDSGSSLRRSDDVFNATPAIHGGVPAFTELRSFDHRVTAMVAAPADPAAEAGANPPAWNELWVGLINGDVFQSQDRGGHFQERTPGPERPVTGIAVDPQDSRRAVVTYGEFRPLVPAYRTGNIYFTEDRGRNWRDISGTDGQRETNLPDVPILSVAFANTQPSAIIVGTEVGVLYTTDLGATWRRLGTGVPNVAVLGLGVFDPPVGAPRDISTPDSRLPPVAVATYGRGVWMLRSTPDPSQDVEFDGAFGALRVGRTLDRTFRFYNRGRTAIAIESITLPAGPFTLRDLPSLPHIVVGGQGVAWVVRCAPTAAGIARAETTVQTDLSGGSTITVPMSVEGMDTGVPRLAIDPIRYLPFGPIPSSADPREATVTLSNTGADRLDITQIQVPDFGETNPFVRITTPVTTPIHLEPGETFQFTVRFDPGGAQWPALERDITIRSNDPTGPRTLTVTGGKSAPTWAKVVGVVVVVVLVIGAVVVVAETTSE